MELILTLVGIFILLILSAFFSGSETAMTAASQPRMLELERKGGHHRAALVNRLLDRKDRLIGAILLGNNMVNILASALATSVLIGVFGEAGVIYATILMTLLILIFSEVLPKAYALYNPDKMALAIAPVLRVFVVVFAPTAHAVQWIVERTLKIFGVELDAKALGTSNEEELRGVISLHQGPDPEVEQEREMLASILDLGDLEVEEIMTHRSGVAMIDAARPTAEIVSDVLESPHTRLPVYEDEQENVIGVVHAKDMWRAVQKAGGDLSKVDIKTVAADPWFVPEATSALDQMRSFRKRHEHFAVVIDEYGSVMGIVTLEDILEEIVGDISDEHDRTVKGVRPGAEGTWVVNGDVTIRDLNRELNWDLPDEDAATLAGLVMHEARRIPEEKQIFAFHGFRFKILRRKKHRITSIRVSPLDTETEDRAPTPELQS